MTAWIDTETGGSCSASSIHRRAAAALLWMGVALAPLIASAEGIVRWVDDKGQVHYSDHAPPGSSPASVVHAAAPPADPAAAAALGHALDTAGAPEDGAAATAAVPDPAALSRKRQAEQQRIAEDLRKKSDQAAVARCREQHETYCNQGAEAIRQHDKMRELMECADNLNQYGAQNPYCRSLGRQ